MGLTQDADAQGFAQRGFVTTQVDNLVNWARTGSLWPQRSGTRPVDEIVDLGRYETALRKALRIGVLGQSHSSAPFFHS